MRINVPGQYTRLQLRNCFAGQHSRHGLVFNRYLTVDQHPGHTFRVNLRVFEGRAVDNALCVENHEVGKLALGDHAPIGESEPFGRILRQALDDLLDRVVVTASQSSQNANETAVGAGVPTGIESEPTM